MQLIVSNPPSHGPLIRIRSRSKSDQTWISCINTVFIRIKFKLKMAAHSQARQESEVDTLINIWLNETIQVQLLGFYRNMPIYRKIEWELWKLVIMRGWKQCCDELTAPQMRTKTSWKSCAVVLQVSN